MSSMHHQNSPAAPTALQDGSSYLDPLTSTDAEAIQWAAIASREEAKRTRNRLAQRKHRQREWQVVRMCQIVRLSDLCGTGKKASKEVGNLEAHRDTRPWSHATSEYGTPSQNQGERPDGGRHSFGGDVRRYDAGFYRYERELHLDHPRFQALPARWFSFNSCKSAE
jgi:hypothetical protein